MTEQRLVVGETLSASWTTFKQHWQLLLSAVGLSHLVLLGYVLLAAGLLSLLGVTGRVMPLLAVPVMILLVLGGALLSTWLHLGFQGICLAVQRGQTPALSSLFAQRKALGRGFAASFLLGLLTVATVGAAEALPLAGDVLLGLVASFGAVLVSFAYYFILDRDRAALNAVEASVRTLWRGGLPAVGLVAACFVITVVTALIPLVGSLIGYSLASLAYSEAYLRLVK